MKLSPFVSRNTAMQWLLYSFLIFAILWRGGKSIDTTWILTGVTFLVVLLSHHRPHKAQPMPWLFWLPVIFLILWTLLSFLLSSTSNYGTAEVLRSTSLLLLFLWAIRYVQQEDHRLIERGIHNFIRVISMITLLACAIGIVVYIFQPVNRFVGTFFDARFHTDYWPNAWANYLLLTWPMVYYWVLAKWKKEATRAQRTASFLVRGLLLALVLCCLFLTYSRGGNIAFAGQLLLWAGISYTQLQGKAVWIKAIAATVGIFILSAFFFLCINSTRSNLHEVLSVQQKVTFSASEGASSASERSIFWKQALSLTNERPFFGWGPYSFRFVQPHMQTGVLVTSDHPHNIFLKVAAETGWPAVAALCVLLLLIFLRTVDAEIQKETHIAPLGTLFLLGTAGVLSHSLIDYNLQFIGIALPFWLILGFLAGYGVRPTDSLVPQKMGKITECSIATAVVLFALYEGVYLVTSSLGRHAEAAGEQRQAIVWYERSINEIYSRDLHLSRASLYRDMQQYTTAERALWDYFAQNEQDFRAWKMQGQLYEYMNQPNKALTAYQVAYDFGKYNDIGILKGLILSYINTNQRSVVDSRKEEFDALLQNYANAIVSNAHFIALSTNVEHFIELCEILAELYPDEAPIYIVLAARADDHATIERARLRSRPPGFLW